MSSNGILMQHEQDGCHKGDHKHQSAGCKPLNNDLCVIRDFIWGVLVTLLIWGLINVGI